VLARVFLGLRPSLRRRLPGFVRRLHRYSAESDFSCPCIIGFGSSLKALEAEVPRPADRRGDHRLSKPRGRCAKHETQRKAEGRCGPQ
jgi:hypothetical protein